MVFAAVVSILVATAVVQNVYGEALVESKSFEYLKQAPESKVCLFYCSSSNGATSALEMLQKAAKRIHATDPHIHLYKCDGDDLENMQEFVEAGFSKDQIYLFTADQAHGIEKYSLGWEVETIVDYVQLKLGHYDGDGDDYIFEFTDEDEFYERMDESDPSTPQFVKFYESWCGQCQQLKPTFERAALHFNELGENVHFVEVECSKNKETKLFCERHQVKSYPTLKLFTGENQYVYDEISRDILSFQKFFREKLPDYTTVMKEASNATESTPVDLAATVKAQAEEITALKEQLAKKNSCDSRCTANMDDYVRDL